VVADTWDTHSHEDVVERVVGHVANAIEDWRDTCPRCGGRACGAILIVVWWLSLKTTQLYGRWVFDWVWPQNPMVAVPTGTGGGT
jgi:hypothetical protein